MELKLDDIINIGELNDNKEEEAGKAEVLEKAKDAALTYLSYGIRTESQMRSKLAEKGFEGVIDETIDFLKEYKYVDDLSYGVMYIRQSTGKGHGALKIKNALRERGVDKNTIEDAFYEYEHQLEEDGEENETEAERALKEALKVVEGKEIDDKLVAKAGRRLKGRGFGSDAIYYALGRIMNMKKNGDEDFE